MNIRNSYANFLFFESKVHRFLAIHCSLKASDSLNIYFHSFVNLQLDQCQKIYQKDQIGGGFVIIQFWTFDLFFAAIHSQLRFWFVCCYWLKYFVPSMITPRMASSFNPIPLAEPNVLNTSIISVFLVKCGMFISKFKAQFYHSGYFHEFRCYSSHCYSVVTGFIKNKKRYVFCFPFFIHILCTLFFSSKHIEPISWSFLAQLYGHCCFSATSVASSQATTSWFSQLEYLSLY